MVLRSKRFSQSLTVGVQQRTSFRSDESTMSHSVTIRTQTVTTGTSTIVINTGYLGTWGGIFKALELALGIVCVGILGYEIDNDRYVGNAECFFFVISNTFMIGTFILLVSCMASYSTASIISKTIYELLYHCIAFILLLASSLMLLVRVNRSYRYELTLGASICGLINTTFYLLSTIIALRTYRGL